MQPITIGAYRILEPFEQACLMVSWATLSPSGADTNLFCPGHFSYPSTNRSIPLKTPRLYSCIFSSSSVSVRSLLWTVVNRIGIRLCIFSGTLPCNHCNDDAAAMTEPTAAFVPFQRLHAALPPTQIAHSAPASLTPASHFSGQKNGSTHFE